MKILDSFFLAIYRWHEHSIFSYEKYVTPPPVMAFTFTLNILTIKGLLFGNNFDNEIKMIVYPLVIFGILMYSFSGFYSQERIDRILEKYKKEPRNVRHNKQALVVFYILFSVAMMVLTIYLNHHYVMIFEKA